MTTTRHIIDITKDNPAGYEADETSQAKGLAFDVLEDRFIPDSGDAIHAADLVVERLIKAGWRPTVEEPAAERMGTERPGVENADTGDISAEPSDVEVRAAARALGAFDGTNWDSLRTRGRETYSNAARAVLFAARKAARHE